MGVGGWLWCALKPVSQPSSNSQISAPVTSCFRTVNMCRWRLPVSLVSIWAKKHLNFSASEADEDVLCFGLGGRSCSLHWGSMSEVGFLFSSKQFCTKLFATICGFISSILWAVDLALERKLLSIRGLFPQPILKAFSAFSPIFFRLSGPITIRADPLGLDMSPGMLGACWKSRLGPSTKKICAIADQTNHNQLELSESWRKAGEDSTDITVWLNYWSK